jgi:acyl-coenzyme A thioesterase PaaI-like protein
MTTDAPEPAAMSATVPSLPQRNSISDLDITTEQLTATRARSLSPVTDAVRDPSGAAGLGYFVALVDVNTAMPALCASHPDWIATADLMLHEAVPLVQGPAILESNLSRAGSRLIVVGIDIYDGEGMSDLSELSDSIGHRRVATGLVTFARVPAATSAASGVFDPLGGIGQRRRMEPAGGVPTEPLLERIGLTVVDAEHGVVELASTPYVHNSRGRINGGVLGMVFQGAAEAAAPGYVGSDLHIHYLAGARRGPVRTSTDLVRAADDHVVCRVEAIDTGADDLVLAVATVTLQRITS